MEHGGERKESMWKTDSGAKDLSGVGEYASESGKKSRERAGMEQGSWFVQGRRLVELRGFRSGD